jgi:hypothetical protein
MESYGKYRQLAQLCFTLEKARHLRCEQFVHLQGL